MISSITKLVNLLLNGNLGLYARDLFFSANLTALKKKDGGIRPIAVGNVFRRLAAKVICHPVTKDLGQRLQPVQLGVGVPSGSEVAAHSIRHLLSSPRVNKGVMVKLDLKNAFNSVRRDHMLEVCHRRAPSIFPLARLAYGSPSSLLVTDKIIHSSTGVQQGDPLGPLLFALAVDDIARSLSSPINLWYLDDATIAGPADLILKDIQTIVPALEKIGLHLNAAKSEIINLDLPNQAFATALSKVKETLDQIQVTPQEKVSILGAPILLPAIRSTLESKEEMLKLLSTRLQDLDAHPALFLLTKCFALPRLLFSLRSAPCFLAQEHLLRLDQLIRQSASKICNVFFDDTGWKQASLPNRHGGIGLRAPSDVSLSAYLSSRASTHELVLRVLNTPTGLEDDPALSSAKSLWSASNLPSPTVPSSQHEWDDIFCKDAFHRLSASLDQHRLVCLKSAASPFSGAWTEAIPSPATGTLLDDNSVRVGVALRLGLRVCEPHRCRCGKSVDSFGLHPLSCSKSSGRLPRHAALNDTVKRALDKAGFPAQLEPVGLDRGDGKRPDGITIFPFKRGKPLVWDATCSDTFADSNLLDSLTDTGAASRRAEIRKLEKYRDLSERFLFEPFAFETSGVLGPRTLRTVLEIGRLLTKATGDPRESSWLVQRFSLALVRGNATCIRPF